jgi:amino acid transporter
MLVLTLQGSFISALTISTLIRLITYALTCIALPVLRRRSATPAGFTAPGGAGLAVAAVALCAWLVSSSAWRDIRLTGLCALAGLVLYFVFRGRQAPLANA